jgi:hypothetical protein
MEPKEVIQKIIEDNKINFISDKSKEDFVLYCFYMMFCESLDPLPCEDIFNIKVLPDFNDKYLYVDSMYKKEYLPIFLR